MLDKNTDIRTIKTNIRASMNDDDQMKISGTAVVFGKQSENMGFYETITRDALNGVDLSNVLLLYNHDFGNILARTSANNLNLSLDNEGLHFEATLPNTTLARDVYADIQAGNVQGCSFGFQIADEGDEWTVENRTQFHTINQISEVVEISLTPIPAYTQTSVGVQRSLERRIKEDKKMDEKKESKEKIQKEEKENKKEEVKPVEKADKKENKKDETRAMDELREEVRGLKDMLKQPEIRTQKVIKPSEDKGEKEIRSFEDYLKNGDKYNTRDVTGIGLPAGQVLIPKTIMPAEHKTYQFPRLGSLVRTVSVKTTTGMLPIINLVDDKLAEHTEFASTTPDNAPQIQEIDWKLKTYTGRYVFSQELIQDSTYDWQGELSGCLQQLKDNTDDFLIMSALTTSPAHKETKVTDVIGAVKDTLNKNLMPVDSSQSTIVLSQSAFNYIDKLNDKIGRPLVNDNFTQGMGKQLLGHQMIVVADTLFPSAKAGDGNIIIAPMQKAVINFKQSEITGQFQDTYDAWYKQLGIFLREDVVAARPDLVTTIQIDNGTMTAVAAEKA